MKGKHDRERGLAPHRDSSFMSLRDAMNQLFDESFWDPFSPLSNRSSTTNAFPLVDVSENDTDIKVVADVPGMNPDDIEVTVDDDVVTLSGSTEEVHSEEDEDETYYYYERSAGSFHRAIPLPARVDPDKVTAKCRNGVLTISLPKLEEKSGRKVDIET